MNPGEEGSTANPDRPAGTGVINIYCLKELGHSGRMKRKMWVNLSMQLIRVVSVSIIDRLVVRSPPMLNDGNTEAKE